MSDIRRMIMYGLVAPLVLALSLYGGDQLSVMMSRGTVVELPRTEVGGERPAICRCVNCAPASAFEAVPGIGPALTERIMAERDHTPFDAVGDVARVRGIGAVRAERVGRWLDEPCTEGGVGTPPPLPAD